MCLSYFCVDFHYFILSHVACTKSSILTNKKKKENLKLKTIAFFKRIVKKNIKTDILLRKKLISEIENIGQFSIES